ncbi:glycoside hydrolase [Fomitiporia mediterranea MF3/22]|uniref:glycoside hydrolase n=1 Tax=Fomitiporia mediterranea (strain MF3/22) TaxID=694068 RepID=UPI0004407CD1|nr:glycoside hydrolase [Fomitiporia mediterranea MF3/22]EJD05102.1 glycoside hydrolase [Fomitiporia mediterranea MF3/22]
MPSEYSLPKACAAEKPGGRNMTSPSFRVSAAFLILRIISPASFFSLEVTRPPYHVLSFLIECQEGESCSERTLRKSAIMRTVPLSATLFAVLLCCAVAAPQSRDNGSEKSTVTKSRLQKITSMYAFEGFVYALDNCPSWFELVQDFGQMRAKGARNVITFDYCGDGADASYYGEVIQAAGFVGLNIIPLAWTLLIGNQTLADTAIPKINAVTKAVIENPEPVLAVALGDEPLFDNDFGSADNLAKFIRQMKTDFASAGLSDIPVSTSELAFGWQSSGNITEMVDAVDFFMINNFPYFAFDATTGGSNISWADFLNDMNYYASIAQGKPLLVTQTGWPSNEDEFAPNSPDVVASVPSEEAYWDLLDSHCEDFFKAKNIGWMWRSWDDTIEGWGVKNPNGTNKWNFKARRTC